MSRRHIIIPIFVPHKGCPHDCVFCNQRKITGQIKEMTASDARTIIKSYLEGIDTSITRVEIAFFGGSFTAIPMYSQNELLEIAHEYKKLGKVSDIRLSTRPDCIDKEIVDNLGRHGVTIVELGVQSMCLDVLLASNRGHNDTQVVEAVALLKQAGFSVGVQVMLGLPEDSYEKSLYTVKKLIELKPDFARIYPTLIIKDTYLETMYENGEYKPLSLDECVDWAMRLYILFLSNNINVIRIGLQPTDTIAKNQDVVGGPFHPAFRQLVENEIYKHMLIEVFNEIDVEGQEIRIMVNPLVISDIIGQASNISIYMKTQYKLKSYKIIQDKMMDIDSICIFIGDREINMSKKDFFGRAINKGLIDIL